MAKIITIKELKRLAAKDGPDYEINSQMGKDPAYDKWAVGAGFTWREYEEFWICWKDAQKVLIRAAEKL